jgi:hypothetical protein
MGSANIISDAGSQVKNDMSAVHHKYPCLGRGLYINVTKGSKKTVWTINILVSAFSVC